MKKLIRYLKNYKLECVFAPLLKALEATFELLVPIVIAQIIDESIPAGQVDSIISKGMILLLLAILGIVASVSAQFFAAKAAVGFSEGLRHDLFSHMLNLSFSDLDNFSTSTMINRITTDVNSVQTGVNMVLRLFLRSPFIVIGATVMAVLIDVKSAVIFIVLIVVLFVVTYFIVTKNIPLLKTVQVKVDAINTHIRANLNGSRVIRAFNRQNQEISDFSDKNNSVLSAQLSSGRLSALLNPITYVIINLFIVYLIRFGALEVNQGRLTTGQVVALYNYMSQILIELVKFANLIITVNKAFAGAIRINEIFDIEIDNGLTSGNASIEDIKKNNNEKIRFDNVSLKYHGEADEALSELNFTINKGETVGIIGSTGSGKSSLVHALLGFYPVSAGAIYIDGINVNNYDNKSILNKIAIVMQKAVLFKGTVSDNLKWGKSDATEEEMIRALDLSCCLDTVNELGGLEYMIASNGNNLSGGQKQRLSIARALIKQPEILVLDDSSSALDYITDSKLKENLKSLKNELTVIMISQRCVSIKDSDKIIVLDDGRVVGIGKHDELLNNCEVYKEIYNSQV